MDYYCLEDNRIYYSKFINSKIKLIQDSLKEFNSNNHDFKKTSQLDQKSKLHYCCKKRKLKKYIISFYNYKKFKTCIKDYLVFINIKNINDELKRLFQQYKSIIIEDRLNIGSKMYFSPYSDEIYFHEWCTLINKSDFNKSSFFFISNYISDKNFNYIKGELSISLQNKSVLGANT